jgi:hypothetical protein
VAFTYFRNDGRRRVEVRSTGAFNTDEIMQVLERQRREGTSHFALLVDARLMTGEATFDDLDRIRAVETDPASNGEAPGPLAIVVTDRGLYRKACAYVMSTAMVRPAQVFEDRIEAERWLEEQGF